MALRIYLDTSVVSAYFDDRYPERQKDTVTFWKLSDEHEFSISELTRSEIQNTQDENRKNQMLNHIGNLASVPINNSVEHLANLYLDNSIFSPATLNDALHVAATTISRQDILVSWNFRHLVNRYRRAKVNEVNILHGYPTIEIIAPPEV